MYSALFLSLPLLLPVAHGQCIPFANQPIVDKIHSTAIIAARAKRAASASFLPNVLQNNFVQILPPPDQLERHQRVKRHGYPPPVAPSAPAPFIPPAFAPSPPAAPSVPDSLFPAPEQFFPAPAPAPAPSFFDNNFPAPQPQPQAPVQSQSNSFSSFPQSPQAQPSFQPQPPVQPQFLESPFVPQPPAPFIPAESPAPNFVPEPPAPIEFPAPELPLPLPPALPPLPFSPPPFSPPPFSPPPSPPPLPPATSPLPTESPAAQQARCELLRYPLPECYTDDSNLMCCNPELEDTIKEAFQGLVQEKGGDQFHRCNIQMIANRVQMMSEAKFNTTFEVITGIGDYASRSHFWQNYICKVERDGRFILAYATARQGANAGAVEGETGEQIGIGMENENGQQIEGTKGEEEEEEEEDYGQNGEMENKELENDGGMVSESIIHGRRRGQGDGILNYFEAFRRRRNEEEGNWGNGTIGRGLGANNSTQEW